MGRQMDEGGFSFALSLYGFLADIATHLPRKIDAFLNERAASSTEKGKWITYDMKDWIYIHIDITGIH